MPWPIIIAVIFLVVVLIVLGQLAAAQRRKKLQAWAAGRGLSFSPDHDGSFEDRWPNFDCLRQGDQNRYAHNIMRGSWDGRGVTAFDYHYETTSTDSKGHRHTSSHHFSAAILTSELPLRPLVIRPEGFFDRVGEFFGFDDIDFESAEFSRRFYVKSPDRKWAYDVIHQRTMEFLLSQPQFSICFDSDCVIVYRDSTFRPEDFETAIGVVNGMLDRFPDYLVEQLRSQPPQRSV